MAPSTQARLMSQGAFLLCFFECIVELDIVLLKQAAQQAIEIAYITECAEINRDNE